MQSDAADYIIRLKRDTLCEFLIFAIYNSTIFFEVLRKYKSLNLRILHPKKMNMNDSSTSSDCSCDNKECCPPKKKPIWIKLLSFLVLLIALSIIIFKIFNSDISAKSSAKEAANSSCCDTTPKGDTNATPCCPKN